MNNQKIKSLLMTELNLQETYITGDDNHIKIVAIGTIFNGISQVKRQQMIYTPLINLITKKYIHAISITSYTPQEWKIKNKNINKIDHNS
ncbi:BolA family protein [Buchnera aphidicola]|uniref:BolA family transcriptional regulator n=1 Tax=Buchnera aphidicola (Lipaphis pseudobrassicae) TaxID=1258543 RepID=A0A4D6Y8X7_9GAMM|nr:BolA family protein [Buchnera aphidicola]QCI22240.1 BolA family transcriptional regulator [Buchnera aphidicola (Lipaphis pseudobrassicae)]